MGRAASGCAASACAARPACRSAVLERTCRCPRASVGSAGRITQLTHPDRTVVEPSSSGLERTRAARLDTGSTRVS